MSSLFGIGASSSRGFYPETIDQSLRFEGSTTNLSRTFVTPTSTTKFIVAFWIKPCSSEENKAMILGCGTNSSNYGIISFSNTGFWHQRDTLKVFNILSGSSQFVVETEARFRDLSNFQHFCIAIDLTQTSNANKLQIFVNGEKYTGSFLNNTRNFTDGQAGTTLGHFNTAIAHTIGDNSSIHSAGQLSAYLSEFYILDGQSIYSDASGTPNSTFLNSDGDTLLTFCQQKKGIAVPKAYTGTFGNNGCRLTFEATGTGTTAQGTTAQTNIGDDQSGQGHNFAVSGLESSDVVKDSVTNNFATLHPYGKQSSSTLSEGNLKAVLTGGGNSARTPSTFAVSSGKWYWEVRQNSSNRFATGVFDVDRYVMANEDGGSDNFEWVYITDDNAGAGARRNSGSITNGYGGTTSSGQVVMVALDADNDAIWFGKQGSWFNTDGSANSDTVKSQIEAGTTTNSAYTSVTGRLTPSFIRQTSNNTLTYNFGVDDTFGGNETSGGFSDSDGNGLFLFEPPTGFKSLCSLNLPDVTFSGSTAEQPSDNFNIFTYTGDGTSDRNVATNTFTPDLSWNKGRTLVTQHMVIDSLRRNGDNFPNLHSNTTDAEANDDHPKIITNGIQVSGGQDNNNTVNFVNWSWKAGTAPTADNSAGAGNVPTTNSVKIDGSNETNALAGSIPATRLSANTKAGFSITTYTANSNTKGTVAHGLTVAPNLVIIKNRDTSSNGQWVVGNTKSGFSGQMYFDSNAFGSNSGSFDSTAPTNTVVTINTDNTVNEGTDKFVMYCWHSVDMFSKFGGYQGNGSSNNFIYLGFRPKLLVIKRTDSSSSLHNFYVIDSTRSPFNVTDFSELLTWDKNFEEGDLDSGAGGQAVSGDYVDLLSNGFNCKGSSTGYNNGSGTYVYFAWAESPFKINNAR